MGAVGHASTNVEEDVSRVAQGIPHNSSKLRNRDMGHGG